MALLAVKNMAQPKAASMAITTTTCQSRAPAPVLRRGRCWRRCRASVRPPPEAIGDRPADDLHRQAGQHRQAEDQAHGRHRDAEAAVQVDRLEGIAELVAHEVKEGATDKQPELPREDKSSRRRLPIMVCSEPGGCVSFVSTFHGDSGASGRNEPGRHRRPQWGRSAALSYDRRQPTALDWRKPARQALRETHLYLHAKQPARPD